MSSQQAAHAPASPTRRRLANAIRALSMDAVQQAKSGHPGAPMGMADIAEVLWNDFLKHNPANPAWPDRDRFVMSNGHGAMLLYALAHLTGYELSMDDLKRFRQLHSRTPGHPEFGITPGIETTTGPLGQGLANAVGMALAEKMLAARFNRPGHEIVDHFTYVSVGDGCLMEGISHEACSLAGTLKLNKLIAIYDDNGISIDGCVQGWFTDDTPARFRSYGWNVIPDVDGHDPQAVKAALAAARAERERPTLICCKTIIGYGAPNAQGTEACHGSALGDVEVAASRKHLAWEFPPFVIPPEIYAGWDARDRGSKAEKEWSQRLAAYRSAYPELAAELERRLAGELPESWGTEVGRFIKRCIDKRESIATRKASQNTLEVLGPLLPELIGGSADLTGSNFTNWSGSRPITEDAQGNYIYFGVREFAMSAIMSGMVLHGGVRPYGGTFLMFSEYARNAIRMAALMGQKTLFVFTHDSIGLGEDGPTHQAVEQLASLRLIPNLSIWRPCDAVETAVAWKAAIERRDGPTALVLSRQNLPHQDRNAEQVANIYRGGYVLHDCEGDPQLILIATGSEVGICVEAAVVLTGEGIRVRVVSLPSTDRFEAQDAAYRESVLPSPIKKRVVVEAGVTGLWHRYAGDEGRVIGLDRFGESAPGPVVMKHFGFTAQHVAEAARALLASVEAGI